jgi:hypothetical protein
MLMHPYRLFSAAALSIVLAVLPLRAQDELPDAYRHSSVRVYPKGERDVELLGSLDVDHFATAPDGAIAVVVTHADLAALRAAGVRVEVDIAELEAYYGERSRRDLERMRSQTRLHGATPAHFALGSVAGFLSVEELGTELNRMAELYPQLAAIPEQIGTTYRGRPIMAVRISARPTSDASVPEVLYTALHHAREPAGMMSLVYTMWSLLEGYGSDAEITYLLDHRALWFVPAVNPDGYAYNASEYARSGSPGLWRKNMRAFPDSGVDLNRNYGPFEFWNHPIGGSSLSARNETYRGPAPFSEPETQALRTSACGIDSSSR